jgi:hypothetical protein
MRMRLKLTSTTALAFATLALFTTGCPDSGHEDPDAGPTPPEFQACSGDVDTAIDGTIDDKWTYFYDDNDFPTKDELDKSRDGTVDERDEWAFDAHGHVSSYVAKNIAADGSATVYYEQHDVYDDRDLLIEHRYRYENVDGDPPTIRLIKYSYDAKGKLVESTTDRDADGSIDAKTKYIYDGGEYYSRTENDSGLDGTIDLVTTYQRNAAGKVTQEDYDFGNDSTIDYKVVRTYDDAGHELTLVQTIPDDPTYEFAWTTTYDTMGRFETFTLTDTLAPESNAKTTYAYGCGNGRSHARRMLGAMTNVRSEAELRLRQLRAGRDLE